MSASPSSEAETLRRALEAQRIAVSDAGAGLILRDWAIIQGFRAAMQDTEEGDEA